MNPTIRIDEDVFEALKAHAEPLVDTPNSVLRRLLQLSEERALPSDEASTKPVKSRKRRRRPGARTSSKRARSESILSNDEYELPILKILSEKGGQAPTS